VIWIAKDVCFSHYGSITYVHCVTNKFDLIRFDSIYLKYSLKFRVEGVAPTNYSSSRETRINALSYGIKIWTDFSFVLSQSTRLTDRQTDRQTDRILIARPRLHSMQRGKTI